METETKKEGTYWQGVWRRCKSPYAMLYLGILLGMAYTIWCVQHAKHDFEQCVFGGSSEMYCFYDKFGH